MPDSNLEDLYQFFNIISKIKKLEKMDAEIKNLQVSTQPAVRVTETGTRGDYFDKNNLRHQKEMLELSRDIRELNIILISLTLVIIGCGFIQIIIAILQYLK